MILRLLHRVLPQRQTLLRQATSSAGPSQQPSMLLVKAIVVYVIEACANGQKIGKIQTEGDVEY
jgi:hypothetical protein